MSDKCIRSVPAAAIACFQDLSYLWQQRASRFLRLRRTDSSYIYKRQGQKPLSHFERGFIVGAREMGHSISEVAMKFRFARTTISRVYREHRVSGKTSNLRHRSATVKRP
ncbi:hypothetical protein AVEN_268033-1 [Araneus ventricosus]|uniref:Tc3 transposase DNA binding domain-containing protein n=1 Tax=Araneus ventricosus TaxID=182803 RepID=A0A4Y2KBW1_ARAVE|nr:hypothetical protein AVEN_268033-1 [Araneus ventricosus]